jgi:hypothetical protein
MEAVLVLLLAGVALLVWKAMAINEKIEHIDARLSNQDVVLAEYYKMFKGLQPKETVEIPARLDEEIVREMIPYFKRFQAEQDKKYQAPELDDFMYEVPEPNEDLSKAAIEYRKNKLEDDAEKEYLGVLKSGMFWEWYPELTGVWKEDRVKWLKIYNDLTLFRAKYKEEQEYAVTEGSALYYVSEEEAKMIAENIKQRKKLSLNK